MHHILGPRRSAAESNLSALGRRVILFPDVFAVELRECTQRVDQHRIRSAIARAVDFKLLPELIS